MGITLRQDADLDSSPRLVGVSVIGRAAWQWLLRRAKLAICGGRLSALYLDPDVILAGISASECDRDRLTADLATMARRGLWEADADGIQIVSWADYQVDPLATERQRVHRSRLSRDVTVTNVTSRDTPTVTDVTGIGVGVGVGVGVGGGPSALRSMSPAPVYNNGAGDETERQRVHRSRLSRDVTVTNVTSRDTPTVTDVTGIGVGVGVGVGAIPPSGGPSALRSMSPAPVCNNGAGDEMTPGATAILRHLAAARCSWADHGLGGLVAHGTLAEGLPSAERLATEIDTLCGGVDVGASISRCAAHVLAGDRPVDRSRLAEYVRRWVVRDIATPTNTFRAPVVPQDARPRPKPVSESPRDERPAMSFAEALAAGQCDSDPAGAEFLKSIFGGAQSVSHDCEDPQPNSAKRYTPGQGGLSGAVEKCVKNWPEDCNGPKTGGTA